jgi:uncharacterized protein YebE (UPF0316 family)
MERFVDSEIVGYLIVPLFIFLARIMDVSLGTMRIILVSRGNKTVAPLLGFLEILIWIFAISRIMQNLDNVLYYFVYAGGFATGTYVGMVIEERLAIGKQMVRIVTQRDASELIKNLQEMGFGATSVEAEGARGRVHVIFSLAKRSELNRLVTVIEKYNPNAFYTVEDIRFVSQGVFPATSTTKKLNILKWRRLKTK